MTGRELTLVRLGSLGLAASAVVIAVGRVPIGEHVRWFADVPGPVQMEAAPIVIGAFAAVPFAASVVLGAYLAPVFRTRPGALFALLCVAAAAAFLALCSVFADWWVDDAAITFAYSKNLALGRGAVLHPLLAPEEGYSSTLWMLALAASEYAFGSLDAFAKHAGELSAALAIVLALFTSWVDSGRRLELARLGLVATVAAGFPLVVWASSGLEHGFQALLIASCVAFPHCFARPIWPTSVALSLLVLTRPEAPLLVAAVALVYALRFVRDGGVASALRAWPLALPPALVLVALTVFRVLYFGDPLPNPFYAKSSGATLLRLANPLGGGWSYVTDWLTSSGSAALLPLLALADWRRVSLPTALAAALVGAQLVFVISFGGDWMRGFRFIAPVLPCVAVLAGHAHGSIAAAIGARRAAAASAAATLLLLLFSLPALVHFRSLPITPAATVGHVGEVFVDLARRLGVAQPTLAHHDLGGTSYYAGIAVIDLAGLGDREIAKHMSDPGFMRRYLFEQKRPTFVFGRSDILAAAKSQFFREPEFDAQYVAVDFVDDEIVRADLCHVRRDVLRAAPGIELVERDGRIERVVVRREGADPVAGP